MENQDKKSIFFREIIQYVFEAAFFALIIFFLAEYLKSGIITNYFNFPVLLTLCFFSGIMVIAFGPKKERKKNRIKNFFLHLFIIFLSIFFALLVSERTGDSYLFLRALPVFSGIVFFFLLENILYNHD